MPVLLRLKALRLRERARPDRAAARHPPRRDRADPAARLPLLPRSRARPTRWCRSASSRSPRSRSSRPALLGGIFWKGGTRHGAFWRAWSRVRRSGPTRCCCRRWSRVGLAADRTARAGPVRASRCSSRCSCSGSRRTRPDHARHDLEHDRQRRRLRRRCRCSARATRRRRARRACSWTPTGRPRRRRRRFWRGTASAQRAAPAADALHRRRNRRTPRSREFARGRRPRLAGGRAAGRRQPGAFRRDAAGRRDRRRFGAHHGRLGGEGGGADDRGSARDAGRGLAGRSSTATGWSRSRASWSAPPRSCATANERLKELDRLKDDFVADRIARAAHAAHVDPDFLADPARQPGPGSGRSARASSAS